MATGDDPDSLLSVCGTAANDKNHNVDVVDATKLCSDACVDALCQSRSSLVSFVPYSV